MNQLHNVENSADHLHTCLKQFELGLGISDKCIRRTIIVECPACVLCSTMHQDRTKLIGMETAAVSSVSVRLCAQSVEDKQPYKTPMNHSIL